MPTPVLKLRKDIWAHFPVNVDSMGRGVNGADRHCVEWHNGKVRQMAREAGKSDAEMRAELLPKLLHALTKSTAWTVEAPPPGSKCVAVLAMKFLPRNNTRRNNRANEFRRWNQTRKNSPNGNKEKPKSANKAKTAKAANKGAKAAKATNNTTKKAPKNHSGLAGDAMIRKARAILNLMSAATVDRLSHEFATLAPKTFGETEELFLVISEIAMDQQAYHPLIIHLLHVLDARHTEKPYAEKPSKMVADRILARAMEEPLFAKMEVAAEEENSPAKNLEEKVRLQKRFFRSVMLFSGFLYRDGFLTWASYKPLVRHFASMTLEVDPAELDYRVFDGYAQGLMYTLIRAGARMVAEGGEAAATFQSLLGGIERLSKEAKRGFVRTDALEFLESAADGFKIKAGMTWTVGAPLSDVRVKKESPRDPAPVATAPTGLGADVAELWRRFPLDVKQEGAVHVVRFHNKKLRERYEKESGKYRTIGDLEAVLARHILQLVDASAFWKRGPAVPGTLVTIVKK